MQTQLRRLTIKFAGESGQGVNSIGEIFAKSIKRSGYKVFAYREYPSLIKGGFASYQIDVSDEAINASQLRTSLLMCTSRVSIHKYLMSLAKGGILLHSLTQVKFSPEEEKFIKQQDIKLLEIDTATVLASLGATKIMSNTVLSGYVAAVLGLNVDLVVSVVSESFRKKPQVVEINEKCVRAGYSMAREQGISLPLSAVAKADPEWNDSLLMSGNEAFSLGVIAAGVRAMFCYPMTPTSSILGFLAKNAQRTGMIVKQAEDEITAVQMALGSMFMGTRALVATSGGGFDLMTETVSLSGMTETPLVCVLGQRPGPATGMPTWTVAGDLELAIYAGHGEFPRCVLAASDALSGYRLLQQAYNIAEKFQIPVIVLTDKQIAEALFNLADLGPAVPIERGLATTVADDTNRYSYRENGISPRWLPGTLDKTYVANSDEHLEDGSLTEEAVESAKMMQKRMQKLTSLMHDLPEAELIGKDSGHMLLVGTGSVRNTVLDAINAWKFEQQKDPKKIPRNVSYLHYEALWPLRVEKITKLAPNFEHVVLVENNYTGQLGKLLEANAEFKFTDRLLKYDGRPFFVDDVLELIEKPKGKKSNVLFGIG